MTRIDPNRPCPVCGTPMLVCKDTIEGTTCESYKDCPNNCYHYAFSYGSTEVVVLGEEFGGHYTDTPDEFRERHQDVTRAIKKAKENRKP
jgi:hypothetical protein